MKNPRAFSRPRGVGGNEFNEAQAGMTLLDYFAGEAILGMVSDLYYTTYDDGTHGLLADEIAKNAYDLAEAMLKERGKRGVI